MENAKESKLKIFKLLTREVFIFSNQKNIHTDEGGHLH